MIFWHTQKVSCDELPKPCTLCMGGSAPTKQQQTPVETPSAPAKVPVVETESSVPIVGSLVRLLLTSFHFLLF